MRLFHSHDLVVCVRVTKDDTIQGNSDDRISAFNLEGWIDGWTNGHRCLLYHIVMPERLKHVECVFSCRGFNVSVKVIISGVDIAPSDPAVQWSSKPVECYNFFMVPFRLILL